MTSEEIVAALRRRHVGSEGWRQGDKVIIGPAGLELHLSATWPGTKEDSP